MLNSYRHRTFPQSAVHWIKQDIQTQSLSIAIQKLQAPMPKLCTDTGIRKNSTKTLWKSKETRSLCLWKSKSERSTNII